MEDIYFLCLALNTPEHIDGVTIFDNLRHQAYSRESEYQLVFWWQQYPTPLHSAQFVISREKAWPRVCFILDRLMVRRRVTYEMSYLMINLHSEGCTFDEGSVSGQFRFEWSDGA